MTSDVAIVIAVGGAVMPRKLDIDPERNSVHTLVAVNAEDKWSLTAFQNSRAQFIGRPEMVQTLTEELQKAL